MGMELWHRDVPWLWPRIPGSPVRWFPCSDDAAVAGIAGLEVPDVEHPKNAAPEMFWGSGSPRREAGAAAAALWGAPLVLVRGDTPQKSSPAPATCSAKVLFGNRHECGEPFPSPIHTLQPLLVLWGEREELILNLLPSGLAGRRNEGLGAFGRAANAP